ncbi:hypothetical protein [Shinella sp. DD12]|uniref:hypothetical protein n=1 Tax=Shinella sp. DD12 TaxID=1410620 RepID=UPI000561A992|nr:hypothetical protein [Shinella sp. DD12]
MDRIAARQAERAEARRERQAQAQPQATQPAPPPPAAAASLAPAPPGPSLPPAVLDMTGRQRLATLASIQQLAKGGTTQRAIADALGTTVNHLQRWAVEDQAFHDALHCGDEARISLVTDALFENALPREAVQQKTKLVKRNGAPDEVHVTTTRERVAGDTAAQRMFLQAARPDIYRPDVSAKVNILNAQVNPMTEDHRKDPRHLAMALLGVIREGMMAAERNGPLEIDAEAAPLHHATPAEPEPSPAGGAWPPVEAAYSGGADARREQRKTERHDGVYGYGPEDQDLETAMAGDFDADGYDPREVG